MWHEILNYVHSLNDTVDQIKQSLKLNCFLLSCQVVDSVTKYHFKFYNKYKIHWGSLNFDSLKMHDVRGENRNYSMYM